MFIFAGALFRSYPGSWQSMLDIGRGRYKRVALSATRPVFILFYLSKVPTAQLPFSHVLASPTCFCFKNAQGLGEFKVQLGEALNIGDEGQVNTFFRQGYKTSTWWEDATSLEHSNTWRS